LNKSSGYVSVELTGAMRQLQLVKNSDAKKAGRKILPTLFIDKISSDFFKYRKPIYKKI
jgi:hypothetical protein